MGYLLFFLFIFFSRREHISTVQKLTKISIEPASLSIARETHFNKIIILVCFFSCSCKQCDTSFVSSGGLTNHMNSVHGERKYPCEICHKCFPTIHKLKRHSFIHTRVKPYTCPFCTNYASNTQGNLTKHVKTVHQMHDFSYLK